MENPQQKTIALNDRDWQCSLYGTFEQRKEIRQHLKGWCLLYLPHYLYDPPADFHGSLLEELENETQRFIEIIGFRGGAKSTYASVAMTLFCALEYPDLYPFIIPVADTSQQAALNIAAIKYELEYNRSILQDYGRFEFRRVTDVSPNLAEDENAKLEDMTLESEEEWQAKNLLLSSGVRILARSRGQKFRGLRHRQHRPKLIIADDVEDTKWIKSKDNRDTTEKWLRGEVLPCIDEKHGRIILIGNWLHEDALMARMKKSGIFKVLEYPLIIEGDGPEIERCTWRAKYPTQADLDEQRKIVGPAAWSREYLLKIVPEEGQVVKPEDIHYYDVKDMPRSNAGRKGHGVDLAISQKEHADYTACVDGFSFYGDDGSMRIYVQPNPLNAHLDFRETLEAIEFRWQASPGSHTFFVEDVGYQKAAIQELERALVPVEPVTPGTDKRSRLTVAAYYIKNGIVLFPATGCEALLQQLFNFGIEPHDDMVDALVYMILGLVGKGLELPKVVRF